MQAATGSLGDSPILDAPASLPNSTAGQPSGNAVQHALTAANADVRKQIQPPKPLTALPQQRLPADATPEPPAALKAEPMEATGVFKGQPAFTLAAAEQSLPASRLQRQGVLQKKPPPAAGVGAVAAVVLVGETQGPRQKQDSKGVLSDAVPAVATPSSSKVELGDSR